jgi:hypothetical protein
MMKTLFAKTLPMLFFVSTGALTACGSAAMTDEERDALCDEYCAFASSNCQGEDAIYASTLECFETCRTFNFNGQEDDTDGDTAQCRLYHIEVANTDPRLHCPHASPGGGGVCVPRESSACDTYCGQVAEACDVAEATRQYSSLGDCANGCLNFRENGNVGDGSGNTIQCRQTRLNDEGLTPVERCNQAGPESTVCVDDDGGGDVDAGGADAGDDADAG